MWKKLQKNLVMWKKEITKSLVIQFKQILQNCKN